MATDPDPTNAAPGGTNPDPEAADPSGLRDQIGKVIGAARRLLNAHIGLAKAEAGEIMAEVGRVALLGGLAFGLLFVAGMLLPIGLFLFLGDWLFGSIGWGVLLGFLFLVDVALVAALVALGVPQGRLAGSFVIAVVLGIGIGIALGLDLTNRAWTLAAEAVLPTMDPANRPLAIAAASLAIVGAVLGLVGAIRAGGGAGGAVGGLIGGGVAGALLGVLTAIALGQRVGAALGVLTTLIAWPALAGLDVSRAGVDTDALKARFYPSQTIETTKETIEWVRQRTPLGPKS